MNTNFPALKADVPDLSSAAALWGELGLDFKSWLLENSVKESLMPTSPPETDPATLAARAESARQIDASWALEGFTKTPTSKVLDEEYLAGRITVEQALEIVQLSARLTGARSVLRALDKDDPRHAVISQRLVEQTEQLRQQAEKISPALPGALDLL